MSGPLEELRKLQKIVLNTVRDAKDPLYDQQLHPDLSPIGWHLGHCIFTEHYWLKEQLLAIDVVEDALAKLYQPTRSIKAERGKKIPGKQYMLEWASRCQQENVKLIEMAIQRNQSMPLMKNNFLIHFLAQHYAQHLENIMLSLSRQHFDCVITDTIPSIAAHPIYNDLQQVTGGTYQFGAAATQLLPYDNEYPPHKVTLSPFKIASRPVTNSEYLAFIEGGIYKCPKYWSKPGWQWQLQHCVQHPSHWRQTVAGTWLMLNEHGASRLEADEPVSGINYFEAEAFANWAGAHLPHEYEWELACKENLLQRVGTVWEWCSNPFFPYPGFNAFPYRGYSEPYFDGQHYTLKGGSVYTQKAVKRPSFRNYYQACKRHQFAGLRLSFD